MKKILLILSFFAITIPLNTQENSNNKLEDIIKNIKLKLSKIVKTDKKTKVSAVFGVRGNKYDSKNKLYWKNSTTEKTNEKINKEKELLKDIVNKIESGDNQSAKEELEKFINNNSQSQFIKEAKELLQAISNKSTVKENKTN